MSRLKLVCGFCLICISVSAIGCGGSDIPKPVSVTPPTTPPALKSMIEDLAASGQLGSGADALKTELSNLAKTDEAKSKKLMTDFEKLQKLSDPEAVKALAKEMAGKL